MKTEVKQTLSEFLFKVLLAFILACSIVVFYRCNAHAADLEYRLNKSITSGVNESSYNGYKTGFEHELRAYAGPLFVFGSIEDFDLYYKGQTMPAFGGGVRFPFGPVKLWAKVGYYIPEYDQSIPWENGYYTQTSIYPMLKPFTGDNYAINLNPAYGAEVGADFIYPVFKRVDVGLSVSYRALTIQEHMDAWRNGEQRGTTGWISEQDLDFSGVRAAVVLTIHF